MEGTTRSAVVKGRIAIGLTTAALGFLLVAAPGHAAPEQSSASMGDLENSVKGRWAGKPETSLTERMGTAKEDTYHDGGHYLEWDTTVSFGGNQDRSLTCRAELRFESSKLTAVTVAGNDHNVCYKLVYPLLAEPEKKK